MQRCVNVIGVGMSPFSSAALSPDIVALIGHTARQALVDAGVPASSLGSVYAAADGPDAAALQPGLEQVGVGQVPLRRVGQGSDLFSEACQAIAQGQAESILVLGVQSAPTVFADMSGMLERLGSTAREYMARYQARRETFAMIAVKARQHAALNPLAAFRQTLSLDQVLGASMLAEPLTQPQFAWPAAGAAALLLCSSEFASRYCNGPVIRTLAQACVAPVQVAGATLGSTFAEVGYDINVAAARELYEQAGRGPQEVEVCELHDCSTLNELLLYEALGFCLEGSAEKLVEEGDNTYGGNLVVNPSGGLLSLGQAQSLSALAQCIELTQQLRGSAGRRQVANARIALQHHVGATGTVITTLYQRS